MPTFLHGIAGIGKSELAKAYAKQHRKEYTNVLSCDCFASDDSGSSDYRNQAFPYMQKYGYEPGMELILSELASMLKNCLGQPCT